MYSSMELAANTRLEKYFVNSVAFSTDLTYS